MIDLNKLFNLNSFALGRHEKNIILKTKLFELIKYHYNNCQQYRKILNILNFNIKKKHDLDVMPFIPVRLFKDYDLLSMDRKRIIKIMASSGTSGQKTSKIFLDKITSLNQIKVLTKIVSDFIGNKRLPLLIIDSKSVLKNRDLFSARGAGILGFSIFGRNITYALDENMKLEFNKVKKFCKKYKNENILIFGFTSIIWEYFYKALNRNNTKIDLKKAIMIHGGGWKKLNDQKISNLDFKKLLKKICGVEKVHNYYGMVEQTGSIFMECDFGFLHSSIFSEVIIRNTDFTISHFNKSGLIELISLLPLSYPGHIILTEDIGTLVGEDDCLCGRLGKYFLINGRVKEAEIRGCSDTYEN